MFNAIDPSRVHRPRRVLGERAGRGHAAFGHAGNDLFAAHFEDGVDLMRYRICPWPGPFDPAMGSDPESS